MPCEPHKHALMEAAATGAEPQAALRVHLDECTACRAAFADELSLFSSIDAGLRAAVAPEMPASLLPRVRARLLDETSSPNRWMLAWAPAAASAALILGFLFFRGVRHDARNLPIESKQAVRSVPPFENSAQGPGNQPTRQARNVSPVRRQQRQADPSRRELREPRALVPAEQPEVIARLLDGLRRGEVKGEVLLADANGRQPQDLQIAPLTVAPIDVKELDGAQPSVD